MAATSHCRTVKLYSWEAIRPARLTARRSDCASGTHYSPPSRRGGRADQTNGTLPQVIGAAGEVRQLFGIRQMFDLPRRSEAKVAWHLLDRRGDPSSKEGKLPAL